MARRLVIVSNRLPVTTDIVGGDIVLSPASGGLATGLRGWHEQSAGVWIGWPGTTTRLSVSHRRTLDAQLAERRIVPVHLTRHEVKQYYDEFSNGVLWPVFHYLLDRVPLGPTTWDSYKHVNERFADVVAEQYRPGDLIWIHDYHLLLLPGLLRRRQPDARIGFFLHIPFPAAEIFRILPWRHELLEGLLGADLIGFHTYSYLQHFATALADLSGVEPEYGRAWVDDREVRFGVFPMGIDAAAFRRLASSPAVEEELRTIRRDAHDRKLLVGVDRLDYTKGIPHRLLAIETLLKQDPGLRDRLRLIQVAAPSRGEVPSYQAFGDEIDGLIGRINGTYGTTASVPIHYLHQPISQDHLVALYRAADVMLVTPLRDGMNLVAKEFIASRIDDDGVLVLSEFAGAAEELPEAVSVNAYDVQDLATKIAEALALSADERTLRMKTMRRRVMTYDVRRWADEFVDGLARDPGPEARTTAEDALKDVIWRCRTARALAILLDYDGVPLLASLAGRPNTMVHIVSGRARDVLDAWFGALPIAVWAEDGIWVRPNGVEGWAAALEIGDCAWMAEVRALMQDFVAATPGAFIEDKTASIGWHYRKAVRGFGEAQARELRIALSKAMADRPVQIMEGKKVLEVRPRGAAKAGIAQWLLSHEPPPELIVAFGDDRTDEEMFAALPPGSVSVHVGAGSTMATHRLRDWTATRTFLSTLAG